MRFHCDERTEADGGCVTFVDVWPRIRPENVSWSARGRAISGLVTLRAKECIEQADVIVYDYLCNPEMLKWAPDRCRDHLCREKSGRAHADAG